jgi:ribosomal protein S18 acetylase RimI-like enzyme
MAEKHFTVREATIPDIPALAALGAELIRFHHQLDPQRFEILSQHIEVGYARFLQSRLSEPQAVVLAAEGAGLVEGGRESADGLHPVVGYAFGQVEGPSWPDLLGVHGRFHDLMVHEERRGLGIGAALVKGMLERLQARGAPRIVLMTAWANADARSFFEKLGFRPTMVEMTK